VTTVNGAEKIFREQIYSIASRAQLEGAIDFCREGDMLVVCKLDRLARSVRDLVRIIDTLKAKDVGLRILKEGIAKAHSEGKYRGRAPTARAKADQVFALDRAGKTREAIAKEVGISLVSVYRILRTRKDAEKAPRRD
jgi:DNA invertase Pin-like site-specific DNA recombinase